MNLLLEDKNVLISNNQELKKEVARQNGIVEEMQSLVVQMRGQYE